MSEFLEVQRFQLTQERDEIWTIKQTLRICHKNQKEQAILLKTIISSLSQSSNFTLKQKKQKMLIRIDPQI